MMSVLTTVFFYSAKRKSDRLVSASGFLHCYWSNLYIPLVTFLTLWEGFHKKIYYQVTIKMMKFWNIILKIRSVNCCPVWDHRIDISQHNDDPEFQCTQNIFLEDMRFRKLYFSDVITLQPCLIPVCVRV